MSLFKKDDITWDGRYFKFKPEVYQRLKKVFSDKDTEDEIKKAERWALYNPPKKNWTKFVCNWLNRANGKQGIRREQEKVMQSPKSRENFAPAEAVQQMVKGLTEKWRGEGIKP